MSDVDTDPVAGATGDDVVAARTEGPTATGTVIGRSRRRRLFLGQTAIDFWGRRRFWYGLSLVLVAITAGSLLGRGLSLGIDFEGGVAWDVPAAEFTIDDARRVLADNAISADGAKLQERSSDSGSIVKVQVADQPEDVRVAVQTDMAAAAGVELAEVSVSSVSSTWGWEITKQALWALGVFLGLIALYISFRFEWRMAVASMAAMIHDIVVSIGVYSVFQFEVTPATVIAFLTILGYSLYDSIVVFDKMGENERRMATAGLSAADLVNVSTNQVLLRSLNTTIASALPVLSLLLIGAGLLGQITLREFAIALLVGMVTGAYSSLFVATPLLGWLKAKEPQFVSRRAGEDRHLVGDQLRALVISGVGSVRAPAGRRRSERAASSVADTGLDGPAGTGSGGARVVATQVPAERLLSHPPRPRKKKRH